MMNITSAFTVQQASQRLTVSVETVRRYIREGELKAYRIGGGYRIPEEAISEFIIKCNSRPLRTGRSRKGGE